MKDHMLLHGLIMFQKNSTGGFMKHQSYGCMGVKFGNHPRVFQKNGSQFFDVS